MKKILLLLIIFQFAFADRIVSEEYVAKKNYIEQVINSGSSGHKYPMGEMPAYMIPESEHSDMASYIASGLTGDTPKGFANCTPCHGKEGRGNNGMTPNLIKMPIFTAIIEAVKNLKEQLEKNCTQGKSEDACVELAKNIMEITPSTKDIFYSKDILERGCSFGSRDSCEELDRINHILISEHYERKGLDELFAFTSDFIDIPIKLYCMEISIEERNNGEYSVSGRCRINTTEDYTKRVRPFKIKMFTNKRIAKKIWDNLKYEMYLGGRIEKNSESFATSDYKFMIDIMTVE